MSGKIKETVLKRNIDFSIIVSPVTVNFETLELTIVFFHVVIEVQDCTFESRQEPGPDRNNGSLTPNIHFPSLTLILLP